MKNFVHPGQVIDITATTAIESGKAYKVGEFIGVATGALSAEQVASGENEYGLALGGVYKFNDEDSVAATQGLLVGYDSANNKLVASGAGDFNVGHVTKVTTGGIAHVLLIGGGEASGY